MIYHIVTCSYDSGKATINNVSPLSTKSFINNCQGKFLESGFDL